MKISIVMPVLDEEAAIGATLEALRGALEDSDEILVVDGGSSDRTVAIAAACGADVLVASRGRGLQMNAGAAKAVGDLLLFVHADTSLPAGYRKDVQDLMMDPAVRWGRFDLAFDQGGPLLRLIAWLISTRSRWTRSATGDQAIFVRREDFDAVGGYRESGVFEDVDLARRLRGRGAMGIPRGRAVTSSRRWRNRGVWATTFRMWTLKSLYLSGVPASRLERYYRDER